MHKKLLLYTLLGILFTSILGTLLHFVYQWSGNNFWAGLFAPVNESTWEHMKLLFFPMLLYSLFEIRRLRADCPCIVCASALGILAGTFSIPVIFYTYTGILGTHCLFLDICTFLLGVLIGFACSYYFTITCKCQRYTRILWSLTLLLLAGFFLFTIYPPKLGIFLPPK